jgi:hypothetical protein
MTPNNVQWLLAGAVTLAGVGCMSGELETSDQIAHHEAAVTMVLCRGPRGHVGWVPRQVCRQAGGTILNDVSIAGTWRGDCTGDHVYANGYYRLQSIISDNTDDAQVLEYWNDGDDPQCRRLASVFATHYNYTLGADEGPNTRDLDVTIAASTLTLTSQAYVDYYNSVAFCGSRGWQLNVPFDVSGCSPNTAIGKTYYLVVRAEGGKLLFSSLASPPYGYQPDHRAVLLDGTHPLFRQ